MGMLGLGAVTGCTWFDPTINDTGTPRAAGQAGVPFEAEGLASLAEIEGRARALSADTALSGARSSLLAWMLTSMSAHRAAVLRGTPVAEATASASPSGSVAPIAGTWAELLKALSGAANEHRQRALACEGLDALLWGSMGQWAATVASTSAESARTLSDESPGVAIRVAEDQALADVIAQIHVLVFGTELALAPLSGTDSAYETVSAAHRAWSKRRDTLSQTLRERGGTVPGSREPYDLDAPATASAAVALVADMEDSFLATAGVWIASAQDTREDATDLFASVSMDALGHGAPLRTWPGWPNVNED